ncbi:hypothetical protein [Rhizobium sp. S163]|uniref:hypothetical protein n=1 Tax=Rhizobium sp. S163 TaxID=3055039 RepID=UPI0025A9450A|nr:hypothetical protein [Rhizobium sp. S163]MDM9643865.1 hypothetical protein [Rhizobium sp. S163]
MNKFDVGSIKTPHGFIGFYRQVHRSTNFILRDGKRDIIFSTKEAAEKAALQAFLEYLNTPIVAESMAGTVTVRAAKFAAAERKLFKNGRMIPVESKGATA